MIDQERQPTHWDHQELHSERVMVPIVGRLELHVDQVDGGVSASDVDYLQDDNKRASLTQTESRGARGCGSSFNKHKRVSSRVRSTSALCAHALRETLIAMRFTFIVVL